MKIKNLDEFINEFKDYTLGFWESREDKYVFSGSGWTYIDDYDKDEFINQLKDLKPTNEQYQKIINLISERRNQLQKRIKERGYNKDDYTPKIFNKLGKMIEELEKML